ncbi:MAG TPA: SMP-30/gluconolactonase/LRE family protein [Candidatus Marinimicrobia bacterium]|mgnify:FL=1|nr:SMP-30/gluconolactonase/LRE family protein [Candidatus Neomarinimicrobiota bacterium]
MSNNTFSRILNIGSVLILLIQSSVISQVILDPDAVVEEIVSGIQQPEGPVWREGLGLLFSDIKGNKIYKWTSEKGKEIYLDPSYNTNGLAYDLEGRLVAGQMGLRRVVRFEKDGSQTSLADSYDGKKLNSPNDLVIKSDGAIFFTDPDFNIPSGESKELSFNGIYRISPSGVLQLLTSSLALPNGICFSPDESKLYVNDSQVRKIYVWDVVDDSTIANQKLLYTIPVPFSYADGMKIDVDGNIYCTYSSYVWVISPEGELIGKIALPSNVSASNCAWGDDDNRTLFITAGNSVYRVRPFVTSINKEDSSLPNSFGLSQNYPNPFNPTTKITYSIPITSNVMITVYDVSGKEVVTIENCQKKAGTYTLLFNAEKLASGVYYYNLTANEFSSTKKFVILK